MSSRADVTTVSKQGRSGQILPFDMSGVDRTDDGVLPSCATRSARR
ncbi:hypothetical protein [Mycolicibacterium stellerae]|nr:hypothetical protein [Mycolicibacterium stellerae]